MLRAWGVLPHPALPILSEPLGASWLIGRDLNLPYQIFLIYQDCFNLYLTAAGFPDLGHLYRGFRIWTSCIRLVFTWLACVRGTGRFVDDILHIFDFTLAVLETVTDYVPGLLQLLQGRADADRALLTDFGKMPPMV